MTCGVTSLICGTVCSTSLSG